MMTRSDATASPRSNAGPCSGARLRLGLGRAAAPAGAGLLRGLGLRGRNPVDAPTILGRPPLDREAAPPQPGQSGTRGVREPPGHRDKIIQGGALGPAQ